MEQQVNNPQVNDAIVKVVKDYLQSSAFTSRKLTDTPSDDLAVVNRKYVNLNGAIASRPNSSVAQIGQQYFATDLGYPVFRSASNWVNSVGSVIAT